MISLLVNDFGFLAEGLARFFIALLSLNPDSIARLVILFYVLLLLCELFLHVVLGLIARTVTANRGRQGGFAWGFWLGIVGIIVCAMRPWK